MPIREIPPVRELPPTRQVLLGRQVPCRRRVTSWRRARRAPRPRFPRVFLAALACVLVVSACSPVTESGVQGGTFDGTVTMTTTVAPNPPGDGIHDDPGTADDASGEHPAAIAPGLSPAAVEVLAARLPPGGGLAVAPVGGGGEVSVLGDWAGGAAWSTIKVPLAIAAVRADPGATGFVEPAITVSDNAAAEALWAALGGGEAAAAAVGAVLAEAGDPVTVVPSQRLREGFSIFGQAQWSNADQARFAAGLPCLPDSATVLDPMGRVTGEQQWGLGTIPGAAMKGGWGPTADGSGYLVRQFGIVPTPHGRTAVALAIEGPSYADGSVTLSQIASSVAGVLSELPAGEC